MPKRNNFNEEIDNYRKKIRRLQSKAHKQRYRIIYSSDSEPEQNTDIEAEVCNIPTPPEDEIPPVNAPFGGDEAPSMDTVSPQKEKPNDDTTNANELLILDPAILSALGESTEESPKFGEKIHDNLARWWMPILRKGLNKDQKEMLLKQYLVPENCSLLQAPRLNPELSAAVSDATRARDKRVETVQQQLGLGITALNRALDLLLENDDKKLEAIKLLSDSSRILCDLHHEETHARVKFVTPGLDKSFLNVVQDVDRDDMLFGNKLSDKIKASKVIEKQGLQIKKPVPVPKPTPSTSHTSMNRSRPQGNWTGPPRFQPNRGGRGGSRKTAPAGTSNRSFSLRN